MHKHWGGIWWMVLVAATGCGDSETTDGAGGAGGGGPGTEVTIEVTERDGAPLDGAGVSVEDATGVLHKGTTDAAGRATFAIAVAGGGVTVLAHKNGYLFHSMAGISEERATGEPLVLQLGPLEPPEDEVVLITGSVGGAMDPGDAFHITNSSRPGVANVADGDYMMNVAPGEPFTTFALNYRAGTDVVSERGFTAEIVAWQRTDNPATDADTSIDLDFSSPVAHTTVTGSFDIPPYYRDFGRPNLFTQVITETGPSGVAGVSSTADVNSDSTRFEYTASQVDAPGHTLATYYEIVDQNGHISGRWVSGPVASGDSGVALLEPPELEFAAVPQPVHGPVTWTVSPHADELSGISMRVELIVGDGERQTIGFVIAPPDATQTRLIEPPDGTDLADSLSGVLQGTISVCEQGDVLPGDFCDAFANAPWFVMTN